MTAKITFMTAGYCTHPEKAALKNGSLKSIAFPALFSLIEIHGLGYILFDTGYSCRFKTETTKFPYSIYAKITPVYFKENESAVNQLALLDIKPEDIKYIIISHFHADHIGGLLDFPKAKFIYAKEAFDAVKNKGGFSALLSAFLPGLVPAYFVERSTYIEQHKKIKLPKKYYPFTEGFALFENENVIAVYLPGHTIGQIGLFISANGQDFFLVADACWVSKTYQELILPSGIANIIMADKRAYVETINKISLLHKNNPELKIVPSHCKATCDDLRKIPRVISETNCLEKGAGKPCRGVGHSPH